MTKIPDLWNFSTEEEDKKEFYIDEFEGINTVCTLVHNTANNSYIFHITSRVFPEFDKLHTGKKLFFVQKGGNLYFTLTEPKTGVIYKTSAQSARNTNGVTRYKVNFPKKLAESYQINRKDQLCLIQKKDEYLCEIHYKYRENYEQL